MAELSGHLLLRAERREDGRTTLAGQSFRAPFHLSKPYWDADARALLVQVVNPTAGILAGDRLESDIAVGPGAALVVTTPSASRVFKMKDDGAAKSRQSLRVAAGGWLEVLPEPLVPHHGSRFHQTTQIDVEAGGEVFYADLLMPGRVAHGEAWEWEKLVLEIEARVGGELAVRERFEQSGGELKAFAALAGSGDAACFGNAVLLAEQPATEVEAWRSRLAALHGDGLWLGVSALRRGGWSVKFVAVDGVRLRRALKDIRAALVGSFPRLACDARKL